MNFAVIDADEYFKVDIEDRYVIEKFNRNVFKQIASSEIFTNAENKLLESATTVFVQKRKGLNKIAFKKEFERLMIELSWKSSQIEGNTYTLLDAEQLLKYDIASAQYSKEKSIMLLNHKETIEYSFENKEDFKKISLSKIIDIHSLLTKKLAVSKNVRTRLVRTTGTKYLPPDNEFIIKEALDEMCALINNRKNIYEKAFLAILLIGYIKPFEDGNKRTARLVGNAILQAYNCCPLSYRSVTVAEYKKAMLLFCEINNLTSFKKIFTDQYLFAVENYL
ncbi:MAG: Fic family protein [Ferruginibacter sp.]